ncbi:MAG: hypothetical protein DMF89_04430 [Acidobacteria bacterium]|nr:MAG: hypothetical protein DMF89_04430 [Acidobacteriota bacterium]
MPVIRNVLFDAGGTLLDLEYQRLREVLAAEVPTLTPLPGEFDFARGERDARAWFLAHVQRGLPPADAWNGYFERVLAGAGVPRTEIPSILTALWRKNLAEGLWHRPVPDAVATVAALRARGLRLAVVSNAEGRVAADLEEAGDPRIFEIALARLGASPEESVYVGDLYGIDVRGARSAGLYAVLIDRWDLQPDADCPRIACLGELERTIDAAI